HDPYVYPDDQNLRRFDVTDQFTRELPLVLAGAEVVVFCTPHKVYADGWAEIRGVGASLRGVLDACNLFPHAADFGGLRHAGIGRGRAAPSAALVEAVYRGFKSVETGVANEVQGVVRFLNARYADTEFNRVRFSDVQHIAATCPTGCQIVDTGPVASRVSDEGLESRLVAASRARPWQDDDVGAARRQAAQLGEG
ncbi:MAG TPA: hypothetical protein VLA89_17760, partial [Gemmatimonadales bacterium]|nr:hypothetical protein [Gemmatimonadales bacterium]